MNRPPTPDHDRPGQCADASPAGRDPGRVPAALVFLAAAILLFARLGHYAVWDDEAMVTLVAKGILRTGDTSVLPDDHNLVAYGGGILVRDLHDRSTPPLASYVTAGCMKLFGENATAARLPFALFGLATVALMLRWLARDRADMTFRVLLAVALLGNVSFFLFCRQCRYYAPTVFFSVATVYCYLHWRGGWRGLAVMGLCSVLLFAANYFNYLALYACLAADYLLWRRCRVRLRLPDWIVLFAPQAVLCAAVAHVWNPLRTPFGGWVAQNSCNWRLRLFVGTSGT